MKTRTVLFLNDLFEIEHARIEAGSRALSFDKTGEITTTYRGKHILPDKRRQVWDTLFEYLTTEYHLFQVRSFRHSRAVRWYDLPTGGQVVCWYSDWS